MSKLLYLLRTSNCTANPLLADFDKILSTALCTILNVDLKEEQWLQASLPVADGGPGIRSAQMLASSAFLLQLHQHSLSQESILPSNIKSVPDQSVSSTEIGWKHCPAHQCQPAANNTSRRQKLIATKHASLLKSPVKSHVRRGQSQTSGSII